MTRILEVDDQGNISLPADLLGHAAPHTKYHVERHKDELVLRRAEVEDEPTAERRRLSLDQLFESMSTHGPGLPAEAYSREHIYD